MSEPKVGGDLIHLIPPTVLERHVAAWLEEDCPAFDVAGFVVGEAPARARLLGKAPGMLAGVPFFNEVFRQLDCKVDWHIHEGDAFEPIKHCATVTGPMRKILLGERVALNTLARCSGIATKASHLRSLIPHNNSTHSTPVLAGTRKTTPGFRLAEKHALLVAGCDPHRHSLSTMTMLKDNHIACCTSVSSAVASARRAGGFATKVEVECGSLAEAKAAASAGADVIMLDNFQPEDLEAVAVEVRQIRPGVVIEVSGGITEETIPLFAAVRGVDVISTSALHQGVGHVDFSLKIVK